MGEEGVEPLPGGVGAVEGSSVGDAVRGDVAVVRHLAAAGDGEVVVGAGAGEPDVGVVGSEEGEEVVVEEFAAVVDVDGFGRGSGFA